MRKGQKPVPYHDLQQSLKLFQDMDADIIRVQLAPGEYASLLSAENSLRMAVKRSKMAMKVTKHLDVIRIVKL